MQRSGLTMADTAEQWYSWQDDIFLRYPDHRNTPAPPVHWALSLYWSVIQQDQPLVDADVATAVLEQAVALNPWVGEPVARAGAALPDSGRIRARRSRRIQRHANARQLGNGVGQAH